MRENECASAHLFFFIEILLRYVNRGSGFKSETTSRIGKNILVKEDSKKTAYFHFRYHIAQHPNVVLVVL